MLHARRRHLFLWTSSKAGSEVPVMCLVVFTTCCSALWSATKQLHTRLWQGWSGYSLLHSRRSCRVSQQTIVTSKRRVTHDRLEVLTDQDRFSQMWIPRNLKLEICLTAIPLMCIGKWVSPISFLKSTMSFLVSLVFRTRLSSVHHAARCSSSSLYSDLSLSLMRPEDTFMFVCVELLVVTDSQDVQAQGCDWSEGIVTCL